MPVVSRTFEKSACRQKERGRSLNRTLDWLLPPVRPNTDFYIGRASRKRSRPCCRRPAGPGPQSSGGRPEDDLPAETKTIGQARLAEFAQKWVARQEGLEAIDLQMNCRDEAVGDTVRRSACSISTLTPQAGTPRAADAQSFGNFPRRCSTRSRCSCRSSRRQAQNQTMEAIDALYSATCSVVRAAQARAPATTRAFAARAHHLLPGWLRPHQHSNHSPVPK